ncbi:alpha/beta hydrolase [Paenibacillus alvei]|uniref:alpha/beta fold hydrolase n=2 Tax=Paenibacillus alvei TaxID=44250 RepID=UPI00028A008B|nr:alpha/beta fold hydrolase [Paenibacillus alvei]EJW15454.1 putative regulator of chromosome condensation RCC1 [Paenibacillus alvei DSM 29]MCY9708789.1 alpha/beta hydrolase [Paenibacillus alvei]MCY9737936.1 alpha/beta hydrolase [Paenibacillus alvei]MCY9754766.1 alpha/beta hydrolase [Paenibacillus alvei]MEC0084174.1 alpha/beta hydrolase [Paenibacillus alvei]
MDSSSNYYGECIVRVYKHRVILIPGIMASELYHGKEKVWIPPSNPITAPSKIRKLKMLDNGTQDEKTKLDFGLPEPEYYESLHNYLNKQFHVVDFGYDWRFGAEHNAAQLKKVIDAEKASSPNSKIYIVAHSMGGIVATKYISQGNDKNVDKLVTIGTPYLGAPKAAYIFTTGNATGTIGDLVISGAIRDVMPNILSAYELLPSRKYFTLNNTHYMSHTEHVGYFRDNYKTFKYPNYDSTQSYLKSTSWANVPMIEKAEAFHDKFNILYNLNSVDSYYIVGDKIATMGGITVYGGSETIKDVKSIQGDGTVPVISASVGGKLERSRTYYIQEEHSKLPGNSSVQKQIENILLGNPMTLAPKIRRSTETIKTLKLKVECPVDLHVYDSKGNHLGSTGTSSYEENIPFGSYYTDGETKIALLNDGDYNVKLKGNGYGEMIYSLIWSNENDEEVKTVRFDEINVTPNSIFTSGTNENGEVRLQVDQNGDGTVDQTLSPSVNLDSKGTLDETPPTISTHIDGVKGINDWYGKGVYYNILGEDKESGVYKIYYNLNDSGYQEYTGPIPLPNTGIYNFKSYVRDKNRNDSEILTETVKVDTTNPTVPTITVEPIKWTNKFVSITLSGSEDADSGFQKYQYKIGHDGDWKDYTAPVIIDEEGLHNVYARAMDNVFNLSDEVSGEAKVDKTPPSKPEGLDTFLVRPNKIGISWSPSTDNVGVTGYDLYVDGKFVANTVETKFVFEKLISNKSYTFKIIARDEATNSSPEAIYVAQTSIGLATGENHSLQVHEDKTLWAWGKNDSGQLGDGTKTSKTTAVQVVGLDDVISVAVGSEHSLALKSDGTVWGWGRNSVGQVGNDGAVSLMQTYSKPEQVKHLTDIIAIAAKDNSSYALKKDGTVWAWGNNREGQLGDATTTNRSVPVQVVGVSGASQLAAGGYYTYALKTDGTVWGWGFGSALLGSNGTDSSRASLMPGLTGIKSIAATRNSNGTGLALKKDGSVGVWNSRSYTPVSGLSNIEAIAGGSSNYAIAADGSVWNWTSGTPTKVSGLSDLSAITLGTNYTVFSKTDGSIWAWGSINDAGQLGDGTTVAHSTPALVKENEAPKVSLTYPLGTEDAPEISNVSTPSIRWSQEDAAFTNFSAYEVQVLDASGTVIVDSGVVEQAVTATANAWTMTEPLPAGQAFQVRVKVNDEQQWSDWSAVGWLKYMIYTDLQVGINSEKTGILAGENTTVTFAVYGKDRMIDTNFNGLHNVTISGYKTTQKDEFGYFGGEKLKSDSTSVDINFTQGVAEIPLSLNEIAPYRFLFLLDGIEIGNLQLEVVP